MNFLLSALANWIVLPAISICVGTVAALGITRVIDGCKRRAYLARLWDDNE